MRDSVNYVEGLRAIIGHRPIILVGAIVIILDERGRILLQQRKYPYGYWGIPGGLMELEESTEDAARREIYEETQLEIGQMHLINVYSGPQNYCKAENGDEFFVVTAAYYTQDVKGQLVMDDSESLSLDYFHPNALPDDLVRSHQSIIQEFLSTYYPLLSFRHASSADHLIRNTFRVRSCEKRDLQALGKLYGEFVAYHTGLDARFGKVDDHAELFEEYILKHMDCEESKVLVAEDDSGVVGYCLGYVQERPPVYPERRFGYIDNLCVNGKYQSQGVGTLLFDTMKTWFLEAKIHQIELNAAISNPKAVGFWRKMGFIPHIQRMYLHIEG